MSPIIYDFSTKRRVDGGFEIWGKISSSWVFVPDVIEQVEEVIDEGGV